MSDRARRERHASTRGSTANDAARSAVPGRRTLTASLPPGRIDGGGPAPVQRKADAVPGGQPPVAIPERRGGGAALPAPVHAKMEALFGLPLGGVRVHVGDEAAAIGARAYTRGDDIHFAPGAYDPHGAAGQELLGHELAHVVQQRAGRVVAPAQGKDARIEADPALEAEADGAGARVARGEPAGVAGSPTGASGGQVVQRFVDTHVRGEHHIPIENQTPPVGYVKFSKNIREDLLRGEDYIDGGDVWWVRWTSQVYPSVDNYLQVHGLDAEGRPLASSDEEDEVASMEEDQQLDTLEAPSPPRLHSPARSDEEETRLDEERDEASDQGSEEGFEQGFEQGFDEEAESVDEKDDQQDKAVRGTSFTLGNKQYGPGLRDGTRRRQGDAHEWRVKASSIQRSFAERECIGAVIYGKLLGVSAPTELHYRSGRVRGLIVKQHIPGWTAWANGDQSDEQFQAVGLGRLAAAAWFLGEEDMHAGNFGFWPGGHRLGVVDSSGALNDENLDQEIDEDQFYRLPRPPEGWEQPEGGGWQMHQRNSTLSPDDESPKKLPAEVDNAMKQERLAAASDIAALSLAEIEDQLLQCVFLDGSTLASLGQPLTAVAIGAKWAQWRAKLANRQAEIRGFLDELTA